MAKRVKITMSVTVTIDPTGWATEYGIKGDEETVRADVIDYIGNHLREALQYGDGGVAVTVRDSRRRRS